MVEFWRGTAQTDWGVKLAVGARHVVFHYSVENECSKKNYYDRICIYININFFINLIMTECRIKNIFYYSCAIIIFFKSLITYDYWLHMEDIIISYNELISLKSFLVDWSKSKGTLLLWPVHKQNLVDCPKTAKYYFIIP